MICLGIALLCSIFPRLRLEENTYTLVQNLSIVPSHSCNNIYICAYLCVSVIHVHTCVYSRILVYTCVYSCIQMVVNRVYLFTLMYTTCIYVHTCVYLRIRMYTNVDTHIYLFIPVYTCVYLCIHVHTYV